MEVCLRSLQRLRACPAAPPPSPPPCVRAPQSVQTFGRKKTAVAVSYCKKGRGLIKINGCPIELVEPEILRFKVFEPILLLGRDRFANVDIRIRVKGGGYTAQIYGASSHAAPCMRVRCRCLQRGEGPRRRVRATDARRLVPRSHPASARQGDRRLLPEMCAAPPPGSPVAGGQGQPAFRHAPPLGAALAPHI